LEAAALRESARPLAPGSGLLVAVHPDIPIPIRETSLLVEEFARQAARTEAVAAAFGLGILRSDGA